MTAVFLVLPVAVSAWWLVALAILGVALILPELSVTVRRRLLWASGVAVTTTFFVLIGDNYYCDWVICCIGIICLW